MTSHTLQKAGPLLSRLIAAQRLEEHAAQYPQIERWADALIAYAEQLPGCLIWPVGSSAERIVGAATVRCRGDIDVGLWNTPLDGRVVLVFAVAGVTPLSLTLAAEQLRRRGAAEVHGCGVMIDGTREATGLDSFRLLGAKRSFQNEIRPPVRRARGLASRA
jgi:hypothetical protein